MPNASLGLARISRDLPTAQVSPLGKPVRSSKAPASRRTPNAARNRTPGRKDQRANAARDRHEKLNNVRWLRNGKSTARIALARFVPYSGPVRCIITAGPTYEPLDNVRRLTNFSTGRLGSELARFLSSRGHEVLLLLGEQATYRDNSLASVCEVFTTTSDLRERLRTRGRSSPCAVFHAAAVSDFGFGQVWSRTAEGDLIPVKSGKLSTRDGKLLAELVPTLKIITELRAWFPEPSLIVGWKFEVDGDQAGAIGQAVKQIKECQTDACVANGPAYGPGFGLVVRSGTFTHFGNSARLFEALHGLLAACL
jgi:phosphopantothenoylcysteine decarboxylase/phosphopantothenate--cysteine ligase